MTRRKNFRQSNWLIELWPRKNVEPRIVGIRSTFRGSTFYRLVETRLKAEIQNKRSRKVALKPVRQTLVWCRRREVFKRRCVPITKEDG